MEPPLSDSLGIDAVTTVGDGGLLVAGVGDRDAAGGEQEDALADALLVPVDGEGAACDEINRTLSLVRFHHRQIEDDGLALTQGLNGLGHFIEAARLHQIHLSSGGS